MERFQVENLYQANGLNDYKLKCAEDLLKCHGIDFKGVKGYDGLDDLNRSIYEKFIVNFFNGLGLDSRMTLVPTGIFYVEDTSNLAYIDKDEDLYVDVKRIIKSIDKDGRKKIIHSYKEHNYKDNEIVKKETSNYLRVEYKHNGRSEWLHVIKDGKQWY